MLPNKLQPAKTIILKLARSRREFTCGGTTKSYLLKGYFNNSNWQIIEARH
jgi:hypothetical protein